MLQGKRPGDALGGAAGKGRQGGDRQVDARAAGQAKHQQLSDGGCKDVSAAGAMLRGAATGAGVGGMNTRKNLNGG